MQAVHTYMSSCAILSVCMTTLVSWECLLENLRAWLHVENSGVLSISWLADLCLGRVYRLGWYPLRSIIKVDLLCYFGSRFKELAHILEVQGSRKLAQFSRFKVQGNLPILSPDHSPYFILPTSYRHKQASLITTTYITTTLCINGNHLRHKVVLEVHILKCIVSPLPAFQCLIAIETQTVVIQVHFKISSSC